MKILLSAYACEPNRGSEPGVGWNWAIELAKSDHKVWVLTRTNNQPAIEKNFKKTQQLQNLHFLYYDLPAWARFFKKGNRGIHLYYLLWQWGAYQIAKTIHSQENFDIVHHVTFVTVRQPSFMGNLGIPFIFGPVAGGESAPWRLRSGYPFRGLLLDGLRDIANSCVRIDPLMQLTFKQATKIYTTSQQTKKLIPLKYHSKTKIQLAIGFNTVDNRTSFTINKSSAIKPTIRFLYVGRFLYWKGMHLGLQAFAEVSHNCPNVQLTLVGKGPEEAYWKEISKRLRIEKQTNWVSWTSQENLSSLYKNHDIFLFPSFHDSGGMVVLEAMANGLPVVCLKLGGPGLIVDHTCGRSISVSQLPIESVVQELTDSLLLLCKDEALRNELATGAICKAKIFCWKNLIKTIYK